MENINRKEIIDQYKQSLPDAGVYRIKNLKTGWCFIDKSMNLKGVKNKFDFAIQTESFGALPRAVTDQVKIHGISAFELKILERLDVKPEMTKREIEDELELLTELCREKQDKSE